MFCQTELFVAQGAPSVSILRTRNAYPPTVTANKYAIHTGDRAHTRKALENVTKYIFSLALFHHYDPIILASRRRWRALVNETRRVCT